MSGSGIVIQVGRASRPDDGKEFLEVCLAPGGGDPQGNTGLYLDVSQESDPPVIGHLISWRRRGFIGPEICSWIRTDGTRATAPKRGDCFNPDHVG